jgi:hypothetical protein
LIVVRAGQPQVVVNSMDEYVNLLRPYFLAKVAKSRSQQ